jgi:hypothetical protein
MAKSLEARRQQRDVYWLTTEEKIDGAYKLTLKPFCVNYF